MARSNDNHLARARVRLNELHEAIDVLEAKLRELRAEVVTGEDKLKASIRVLVDAKTAAAIEQLSRKEE